MSDALMQYLDEDQPIWSKYQVHKNLQLLRWLIMSMTHCTGFLHIFWVMIMQKWLSLRSSDRAWSMYVRHNCELYCCASLLFASLLCVRFTVVAWGGACSLARPWAAVAPWPVVLCMCCTAGFVTQTVKFLILLLWDLVVMARGLCMCCTGRSVP